MSATDSEIEKVMISPARADGRRLSHSRMILLAGQEPSGARVLFC
jgi:hypothetical protein